MPDSAARKRRKRRKVEHIHVFVDHVELDAAMAELLETVHFLDDSENDPQMPTPPARREGENQ